MNSIKRIAVAAGLGLSMTLSLNAFASGILLDVAVATKNLDPSTLPNRVAGIAYDGTNYWGGLAGGAAGQTLAQWDNAGTLIGTTASGVDYRSIFAVGANLYATDFGGGGIDVYGFTGATPNFLYTLSSTPNVQMELGLRAGNNTLYGNDGGTVYTYDFATGIQTGTFTLVGFSALYPQNVQLAVLEDILLTYDDNGRVGAWDYAGNLLGESLIGLNGFDQAFSFSFTDGLVWIENSRNDGFTGYDIGLAAVSEPATLALIALGLCGCFASRRRAA